MRGAEKFLGIKDVSWEHVNERLSLLPAGVSTFERNPSDNPNPNPDYSAQAHYCATML